MLSSAAISSGCAPTTVTLAVGPTTKMLTWTIVTSGAPPNRYPTPSGLVPPPATSVIVLASVSITAPVMIITSFSSGGNVSVTHGS